jgi:dipeptidyl aminopeptidase/acylaminoacyl peptidase
MPRHQQSHKEAAMRPARAHWTTVSLIVIAALLHWTLSQPNGAMAETGTQAELVEYTTWTGLPEEASWENDVPEVRTIHIPSTVDGTEQPALYYDPDAGEKRPLLFALHSWSDGYTQKASIPYGAWAVRNGWIFIHPDFRGVNDKPEATASELVVQDILDALEYAKRNADVDESRVYLIGFSGGALNALLMAGRYPELWTAVSAWVPILCLNHWFQYNKTHQPGRHYVDHITASCGGVPTPGSEAAKSCARRSPATYLDGARGKEVRLQIAVGVSDDYVPPSHSLRAFNDLAETEDRFTEKEIVSIDATLDLPDSLNENREGQGDEVYSRAGHPKIYERTSANSTLVLFEGGHDIVYNAGLLWLSEQRAVQPSK